MPYSASRGLLYSGPPEPKRNEEREATSEDERTAASTDTAAAPADD